MFWLNRLDEARLQRWAKAVKRRDRRCIRCNTKNDLEAHHIYPKSKYPRKAYLLSNGVTLCKGCHREKSDSYHAIYGIRGNEKIFKRWLKKTSGKEIAIRSKTDVKLYQFLLMIASYVLLVIFLLGAN